MDKSQEMFSVISQILYEEGLAKFISSDKKHWKYVSDQKLHNKY